MNRQIVLACVAVTACLGTSGLISGCKSASTDSGSATSTTDRAKEFSPTPTPQQLAVANQKMQEGFAKMAADRAKQGVPAAAGAPPAAPSGQ